MGGACEKWAELESEAVNYLSKIRWCKIPYKGNSCSLNTFNCCNFHSRLMDNFSQFALWIREWNNCFHEIVEGSKSVSYVLQKQEIHLEKYFLQMAATFLVLEETANFSPHPETLKMLGGPNIIGRSFPRWLISEVLFGQWSSQITASLPSLMVDLGFEDSHSFFVSLLGSRNTFLWFTLL